MRLKPVMLLVIAAGCGLVAMFVFQQLASRQGQAAVEDKVNILVAKAEITPGTKLDETNVEFKEFPVDIIPPNAITSKEEFEERGIKIRVFPGDIITGDKLARKGQHGASNDIPSGMMVYPIPVDTTMAISGLLLPGDRVDVMVTYRSLNQRGLGKDIKTVLEFVEVFSCDQKRDISGTGAEAIAKTITLLVTPEQAQLVALAKEVGNLHLAMRSKEDASPRVSEKDRFNPQEAEVAAAFVKQLEGGENSDPNRVQDALKDFLDKQTTTATAPQPAPEPEPEPKWKIEIYAGDQVRVEEVDWPDNVPVPRADRSSSTNSDNNPLVNGIRALFGGSNTRQESKITAPGTT